MDDIARYNLARWDALVRAQAVFTRPWLDLTPDGARQLLDADGRLGQIAGQRVLCLAGGGGQQGALIGWAAGARAPDSLSVTFPPALVESATCAPTQSSTERLGLAFSPKFTGLWPREAWP